MSVLWTVTGANSHHVLIRRIKCKLHSPLPIWNTLVFVPSDSPITANALQSISSLLKSFLRRSIISQTPANRCWNSSCIILSFWLSSFARTFLLGWPRDVNKIVGIRGFSPELCFLIRHPVRERKGKEGTEGGKNKHRQSFDQTEKPTDADQTGINHCIVMNLARTSGYCSNQIQDHAKVNPN